ncbi:MAG: hypothetical protein ACRDWI_11880 [Jiangellaceae bacterium]
MTPSDAATQQPGQDQAGAEAEEQADHGEEHDEPDGDDGADPQRSRQPPDQRRGRREPGVSEEDPDVRGKEREAARIH